MEFQVRSQEQHTKTPAQCKPSVTGSFLKVLEEFLGLGPVVGRGTGKKVPLHSLLLKTPHPSGGRASPRHNDTGGLGSGGCRNHLGETWEEVAGSICLEMRDRAQSRGSTGVKAWALEGAGFP